MHVHAEVFYQKYNYYNVPPRVQESADLPYTKLIRGTQQMISVEYLVRKTCNRLKFSVRGMSSRAFLINAFCFRRDKNDVLGTKIGQLGFSERQ